MWPLGRCVRGQRHWYYGLWLFDMGYRAWIGIIGYGYLTWGTGPGFSIKMFSQLYSNSHRGDKMVATLSYIHNGNS